MRPRRIVKRVVIGMAFFLVALGVAALFGLAVQDLWNWLMPPLFGLHTVTYWQAAGLLILSWILFRGPRGWGRPGMHRGHHMHGCWGRMTPEEREHFRARMKDWAEGAKSGTAESKD